MPRRNRPKGSKPPQPDEDDQPLGPQVVVSAPPGWNVRAISPARATKEYRCPGCQQEVRVGTQHIVAWREGDEHGRRHWHTPCWKREAGRPGGPKVLG